MAWETPEDTGIGIKKTKNRPVATYVMQDGQNEQIKTKTYVPREKYFQRSPQKWKTMYRDQFRQFYESPARKDGQDPNGEAQENENANEAANYEQQ